MTRMPGRVVGSIKLNGCSAVESARHATNETIVADGKVGASSLCWMSGVGSCTPRLEIQDDPVIEARVGGMVAVQNRVCGIALLDRNRLSGVEPGTAVERRYVPSRSRGGRCRLPAERGRTGGGAGRRGAYGRGEGIGYILDCRRTAAAFSCGRGRRGTGGTRIRCRYACRIRALVAAGGAACAARTSGPAPARPRRADHQCPGIFATSTSRE